MEGGRGRLDRLGAESGSDVGVDEIGGAHVYKPRAAGATYSGDGSITIAITITG